MRLAANHRMLTFPGGQPEAVLIDVQLIDVRTGQPVHRSAPLYLSSEYNGIIYPSEPKLDSNGFASVRLTILPPGHADRKRLNGRFIIWVVIDEGDADDTIEGRLIFTFPVGNV